MMGMPSGMDAAYWDGHCFEMDIGMDAAYWERRRISGWGPHIGMDAAYQGGCCVLGWGGQYQDEWRVSGWAEYEDGRKE